VSFAPVVARVAKLVVVLAPFFGWCKMLQIAALAVSIGLIVLGIKGFTPSGLAFSKTKTLTGSSARIVGALCILGGLGLIPLIFLFFWLVGSR
jgi:hypothetical protein